MAKTLRYPRGFTSALTEYPSASDMKTAIETACDEDVSVLINSYVTLGIQRESWAFRSRVLDAAARLFGDFRQWVHFQAAHNDHIYELNYDYLVDTLNFIRKGERAIAATTLKELLLERPAARHGVATPARAEALRLNDTKEFENYLGKWVAHEGGFEDLLITLHVFFGRAKKAK